MKKKKYTYYQGPNKRFFVKENGKLIGGFWYEADALLFINLKKEIEDKKSAKNEFERT